MPFAEVQLKPGVNVETSLADNPSGVQESSFIRWRADLPEKRGGCTLYINQQVNGVPVSLKPWGDFQGENFLGIATPNEIYTYNAATSVLRDISPQYANSPAASPRFTTTIGSQAVSITDTSAPVLSAFSAVQFNTPIAVGGLILNSIYPITSASSGGHYVIDAGYAATTAVSNALGTLPIFTTTGGISRILVNFPIQYQYDALAVGDRIGFTVPTFVGGITISGTYVVSQILIVSGATYFAFEANYTALYSDVQTMNGGFADITYWITTPPGTPP